MSVFHTLLDRWNEQQRIFMEFREYRIEMMAKVINALVKPEGRPIRVLDLGCGPGSVSHQILELVPGCQVVAIDRDPVLLRIGSETNPAPERLCFIDADLTQEGWSVALPYDQFDAMVSATALHWLSAGALAQVYAEAAKVMSPGGVLMNADHLYYRTEGKSVLNQVTEGIRDAHKARALANGAQDWGVWWNEALSTPELTVEAELHRERWANKHVPAYVTRAFHIEAMRAAGCIEADVIWRDFDDLVLCGVLPA